MDERSRRVERAFQWPILLAALLVVPVVVIQESDVEGPLHSIAAVLNWAIWVAFAVELVTMLAIVPNRRLWLRHHPLDVVVVVLSPPILPPFLQSLRVFRLFRLVRLLRIPGASRRLFSLEGLGYAALLAALSALIGGAAFAAIERDQHLSTWDGIYWAVTTMTTLGSNIYPEQVGSRVIAIVVVLIGLAFVALLTGAVATRFLGPQLARGGRAPQPEEETEIETCLREMGEIMSRMRALEERVARLRRG